MENSMKNSATKPACPERQWTVRKGASLRPPSGGFSLKKTDGERTTTARLLYITCNLEPVKLSRSLTVGSEFIKEYQRCNPGDEIHFLDLYRDNIQLIDTDVIAGYKKMLSGQPPAALTFDEQRKLVSISRFVDRFISFDKYVPVISTWNLELPSKFKLYAELYSELKMFIDTVYVPGKTYKYTPVGTKALLKNMGKKCLLIRSTDGLTYEKEEDHCLLQFSSVMAFMGIEAFTNVIVHGPDAIPEAEEVSREDINKARTVAALF